MTLPRSHSRALCLGAATYDAIAVVTAGGGPTATADVAIARQEVTVDLAGVIGDDETGRAVTAGLRTEPVGTAHMEGRLCATTAYGAAIVPTLTAHRRIITRRAPVLATALHTRSDRVHMHQTGYPARLTLGVPAATRVSRDDDNWVAELDLGLVELYVPAVGLVGARFAPNTGRANADDLVLDAARTVSAAGTGQVVATGGARESAFLNGNGGACGGSDD